MPDLKAFVGNFLIEGEEISHHGEGWVRDRLTFNCDGFTYVFIQSQKVLRSDGKRGSWEFVPSAVVCCENVNEDDFEKSLEVLNRLCWILTFATMSPVAVYGYEYPNGTGNGKFLDVAKNARFHRPVFADGKQIKKFVSCVYETYKSLEHKRRLNGVIDYINQADNLNQAIEVKLIILLVLMENIKHSFAESKEIPFIDKHFRKRPKPQKGRDVFSFKELLDMMFCDAGMHIDLKPIVDLRNEIIHTGLTGEDYSWQRGHYEVIQDIIREYVLRIIGYNGGYFSYSTGGNKFLEI